MSGLHARHRPYVQLGQALAQHLDLCVGRGVPEAVDSDQRWELEDDEAVPVVRTLQDINLDAPGHEIPAAELLRERPHRVPVVGQTLFAPDDLDLGLPEDWGLRRPGSIFAFNL